MATIEVEVGLDDLIGEFSEREILDEFSTSSLLDALQLRGGDVSREVADTFDLYTDAEWDEREHEMAALHGSTLSLLNSRLTAALEELSQYDRELL